MSEKKTYIVDTNVLMSDPNSIFSFQEHDVVIPLVVLEELDRHKSRPDEVGRNAREVTRSLDSMREKGSLITGIPLKDGGTLRIAVHASSVALLVPLGLQADKPDNLIIAFAMSMPNAILVSKDINVRIKCDSLGVKCEDYRKMRVADDPQKFYRGVAVVEVPEGVVDEFYAKGSVILPAQDASSIKLCPNQIVVIKNVSGGQTVKSAIAKCLKPGEPLVPITKIEQAYGLKPRNKEQTFSLDLLFDGNVKLLTLVGPSGCVSPDTPVSVRLSHIHWNVPVPDDTYIHEGGEDEQEVDCLHS